MTNLRDHLILRKLKVWCLLLLAAVFAHALLPISIPEARASGSPLSPSTVEVSTGHSHRTVAVRQIVPQRDPLGGRVPVLVTVPSADVTTQDSQGHTARTTLPVHPGCRCALAQPRAPPIA